MRVLERTEKEVAAIEQEEGGEFAERRAVEARYDFYQKQTDYFRRLSGYLTDRKAELDAVAAQRRALV